MEFFSQSEVVALLLGISTGAAIMYAWSSRGS